MFEGTLETVQRTLFESYVHQLLPKGGKYSVRYLDAGEEVEVEVELPPSKLCMFADLNEVANMPDGVYCCPKSPTFQTVEMLRQPDDICQVTQNLQHEPMQPARVREYFQVLRAGKEVPPRLVYLTYVVPPESFNQVGKSHSRGPLSGEEMPRNVRRRVMRMPLMQAGASAYCPTHP